MADLYYADFSSMDVEELIKKYEDKVDRQRLSKITRTRADEARVRSLLAGYLLQKAVKEHLGIGTNENVLDLRYRYGEKGKPYLADYPQLYFSLSHSGTLVACIVAGQEVGMDIQKYVKLKENLAERFFSTEECILLRNTKDEHEYRKLFFQLWSIKESYIKYTGRGMSQALNSFQIDFDRKEIKESISGQWKACAEFESITFEKQTDFAGCVCMKKTEKIKMIECLI